MIEALKSDELVYNVGGRFKLASLIQKRWSEMLEGARGLIERLREIGEAAETVTGPTLAELDEEASVLHETLSDLLIDLLVEAGLVEPLTAGEGSWDNHGQAMEDDCPGQKARAVLCWGAVGF